jgi:hypothetical protein
MAAPATATTVAITTPRTGTRATTLTTMTTPIRFPRSPAALGYAATSPVPKERRNRVAVERMLYGYGDQSVFGQGGEDAAEGTVRPERKTEH